MKKRRSKVLHREKSSRLGLISFLITAPVLVCLLNGFCAPSSGEDLHAGIIKEALNGTICNENIAVIINGSNNQNTTNNDVTNEPQRHFEVKDVMRCYKYVQKEQSRVLNYAHNADTNPDSRVRALFHFGMMLHSVQDFYSNSNYIRLKVDEMKASGGTFDPYSISPFDWSKVADNGTFVKGGKIVITIDTDERNRLLDTPLGKSTYRKVARGIAIQESMRQWNFLERLLRTRYGEKSATILAALKQAPCENITPRDAEDAAED